MRFLTLLDEESHFATGKKGSRDICLLAGESITGILKKALLHILWRRDFGESAISINCDWTKIWSFGSMSASSLPEQANFPKESAKSFLAVARFAAINNQLALFKTLPLKILV